MKNTSMSHTEGGWPKDVDFTEQSDVTRFRKKAEKDEHYLNAMRSMAPIAERCMNQNNTVDVYEQYFEDNAFQHCSGPPSAKGLAVFRDPSPIRRSVTSIDWHPEISSSKIAATYSITNFQDDRLDDPRLPNSVSTCMITLFYDKVLLMHSLTNHLPTIPHKKSYFIFFTCTCSHIFGM